MERMYVGVDESEIEDDISPPSSPILGYSGGGGGGGRGHIITAAADSETEQFVFCFSCKGRPRLGYHTLDNSFAADGLILRRQLISAIELLGGGHDHYHYQDDDDYQDDGVVDSSSVSNSARGLFFHENLDPFNPVHAKLLLNLAKKNIHILQIMANPRNNVWDDSSVDDSSAPDAPWEIRKQIVHFFNVLVCRIHQLKATSWNSVEELNVYFGGWKDAFQVDGDGYGEGWPDYLKSYTGHRDGNDVSSPLYHLFHAMLELRWSILVIYGMNSEVLKWILEDLVHLAWIMFEPGKDFVVYRQPFNCWCVKEFWTMIRLLCEEMNVNFWNALNDSLTGWTDSSGDLENMHRTVFFPLWLLTHLASLSDYSLNGLWTPSREKEEPFKFNGYSLVISIVKKWIKMSSFGGGGNNNSKPCEVNQMLLHLTHYWGFELEILLLLWNQWLPKVDKILDVGAGTFDNYGSVEKWFKVLQSVTSTSSPSSVQMNKKGTPPTPRGYWPTLEMDSFVDRDSFLSFLKLLVGHAVLAKGTEWKKLKSHIGMNLNKNNVGSFGEIGLLRISTLYISLAFATTDTNSLCDRLKEILQYGKPTSARTKTVLRASCTAVYILLQKSQNVCSQDIMNSLMGKITNLLSQSPLDSAKKDNIMVYLELLHVLPKTPSFGEMSLGRESLISPNLTMWLSSCGPNYVVRTLRALSTLTNWIITSKIANVFTESKERDEIGTKIFERTTQFLTQAVILSTNRVPSTDVEPMANLAADLTLISKWNCISSAPHSVLRLFDHFALYERTCPEVSQYYVTRLLSNSGQEMLGNVVRFVKWCQTWIRLNALDCSIPDQLNELVLGTGYSSTSNSDLLKKLCVISGEWSLGDLHNTLKPLPDLVKAAMGGIIFKENAASRVAGIITAATQILKHMEFGKVYIKNDSLSVGLLMISMLIPPYVGAPPWEKLPQHVLDALKNNVFEIFEAIVTSSGFGLDSFLQRKVQDLVIFALLGYIDAAQMDDDHPGLKIKIYSEDNAIQHVLDTCIPNVSATMMNKDIKLTQRYVVSVTALRNKGLASTVLRFLPGILSVYVNTTSPSELANSCSGVITYCCAFGLTPFKDSILQAFDSVMESSFAFKSRRFFDLSFVLTKCPRPQVKKFLRIDLLPLFERHVRACEQRRGTGTDKSLRDPLEKLERDTIGYDTIIK